MTLHIHRLRACVLLALSLFATHTAIAADANSEGQWFVNLVKANNGTAFCAAPLTTIKELAQILKAYTKAHPELGGRVNDAQVFQALAEHYPCPAGAPTESGHADSSNAGELESYRKKNYSIKTIAPIFSQLVSMSLPKGFQAAAVYEATLPGPRYVRETVLEGETVKQWTQMITISGAKDMASNPNITPQRFVENMAGGYKKACPDSFSAAGVPVGKLDGFETFSAILSCGTSPTTAGRTGEAAMILAIKGEHDYYTIQWAEITASSTTPVAIDTGKWTQRFFSLAPIRICPIVPGEAPPYPSCADLK